MRQVAESVVEDTPNPFAGAPLMIAMSALVARTGFALSSPLATGTSRVPAGALVRVSLTEEVKSRNGGKEFIEQRMCIALDGDQEALGWVTGVSKDETQNLKLAAAVSPPQPHPGPELFQIFCVAPRRASL